MMFYMLRDLSSLVGIPGYPAFPQIHSYYDCYWIELS
jgi:hypothetical protein